MVTENPQQPAMEDILTSIRTGVEEETAKVGSGSADLIDAAAAQDGEEDVLELSADDMVAASADSEDAEELIDIAAFAQSGEAKAASDVAVDLTDDLPAAEPAKAAESDGGGAADEFDRLLAEISQEQQQQVAAAEITKQTLMDEEDPLGAEEILEVEAVAVDEPLGEAIEEAVVAEAVAAIAPGPASVLAAGDGKSFTLGAIEGPEGVQVAFPAEVLAMALRPMVQDWLAKNLPSVVERLVKDEISKLTQN